MVVRPADLLVWLIALERVFDENRAWLTELDSAIGDADHGVNMDRGFKAVAAEIARTKPTEIAGILKMVATVLIKTTGGASGPLYGTFFLRAAAACTGRTEIDAPAFVSLFRAGVEGVCERGKAQPGDKTMLDALVPALEAIESASAGGNEFEAVLWAGASAAEQGMLATVPLQARKGRASYLGPRSAGHQDPGATSCFLLLKTAAETLAGGDRFR